MQIPSVESVMQQWNPQITKMAKKYANSVCGIDDLKQEAAVAIMKALKHFDATRGNEPMTYLLKAIKGAMISASLAGKTALQLRRITYHKIMKENPEIKNRVSLSTSHGPQDEYAALLFMEQETDPYIMEILDQNDIMGIGRLRWIDGLTIEQIKSQVNKGEQFITSSLKKIKSRLTTKLKDAV